MDRPTDSDIEIPLQSSNQAVLTVPETVTMPAGMTEIFFPVMINEITQAQTISVKALIANWSVNADTINIMPILIPLSERQALIDLFNSTDGYNWDKKDNWLGNPGTECSWYGVSCDEKDQHVTGISFYVDVYQSGNHLKGNILDSFGNLTYLSSLDLRGNQLSREKLGTSMILCFTLS